MALIAFGAVTGYRKLASLKGQSQRTDQGPLPPLVRARAAQAQDYRESLRGYGRAVALRRTQVVAEVAGVVQEISPDLEAGQAIARQDGALPVLVSLDNRDLADQLARSEAEAQMAQADSARLTLLAKSLDKRLAVVQEELDAAQRELRRIASLVPKTLSKSALDAQRIQVSVRQRQALQLRSQAQENAESLNAAQAQITVRTRQVDLARRQFERARVRAPFPGRIEARHVHLGARVRVGDPLFTLVDLSRVEVPIALPAARYGDVARGARATARLPDTSAPLWEGQVARVAPEINAADRTFFAYVVIAGSTTRNPAPPGTHLLVSVEGRLFKDVFALPRRAFLGDRIFIARLTSEPTEATDAREAVVEERTPQIVRLLDGVALVRRGLDDGDLVLVSNLESVAKGSVVRLAPSEEAVPIGGTER